MCLVRRRCLSLKVSLTGTSGQYADPQKAAEDLHAFAKLNEGRLYKLLKVCLDPQTDVRTLSKTTVSSTIATSIHLAATYHRASPD
jgi:hypothetical protein